VASVLVGERELNVRDRSLGLSRWSIVRAVKVVRSFWWEGFEIQQQCDKEQRQDWSEPGEQVMKSFLRHSR
jgi:hypothetical protein